MKAITLIKAARLRTLPLSVAGIITGSALAYRNDPSAFSWQIFAWALLTTILFQVLSNFAIFELEVPSKYTPTPYPLISPK